MSVLCPNPEVAPLKTAQEKAAQRRLLIQSVWRSVFTQLSMLNVGGAWSGNSGTITFLGPLSPIDPVTGNTGGSAAIGGFQEGINWQFARSWVVGIEGDWSWTNAGRGLSQALTFGGIPLNFPSNGSLSAKLDWLASARNRLGYLVTPNLMVYGTGGVAWGKVDYAGAASLNDLVGFIYSSNAAFSHTEVGWVAGGGLEWMFASGRLTAPRPATALPPITICASRPQ
jgi:outer membrane immunogenic protein